jgi:hypothetical protein
MKLLLAMALFVSGAAQAGTFGFDDLREACQDPAKFQNQIAPRNIQVTCEDRATKWKSVGGSSVELDRSREIISSFSSDKYSSAPTTEYINVKSQRGSCPKFVELLETINFTKATTCEEILDFKGTETDFCKDVLDQVRESNPKSIEVTETGKVVDLCDAPAPPKDDCDRAQRGQRGQRGQNDCDRGQH